MLLRKFKYIILDRSQFEYYKRCNNIMQEGYKLFKKKHIDVFTLNEYYSFFSCSMLPDVNIPVGCVANSHNMSFVLIVGQDSYA